MKQQCLGGGGKQQCLGGGGKEHLMKSQCLGGERWREGTMVSVECLKGRLLKLERPLQA
jgi:hypothetical protein